MIIKFLPRKLVNRATSTNFGCLHNLALDLEALTKTRVGHVAKSHLSSKRTI